MCKTNLFLSFVLTALVAVSVGLFSNSAVFGQDDDPAGEPQAAENSSAETPDSNEPGQERPAAKAEPADEVADRQSRIADKYKRLEELLRKMADIEEGTNPQRAKLLREAFAQGRGSHIQIQLNALVKLLNQQQFKRALDGQGQVNTDLKALLELLQKEDRARRTASEQERIKQYIKELDRLIKKESSLQGRTEGGADAKDLSKEQGRLADRTGDLADKIRDNEENGEAQNGDGQQGDGQQGDGQQGEPGDKEPGDKEPGDKEPGDKEPGDKEPGDKEPGDKEPGDKEPGDKEPGDGQEGQQPQEGQGQDGQQGQEGQGQQGEGQQDQQQQQQNPARKRVEAAREKMRQAQEKLDEAKRNEAVKDQEEARRLLEQAKAELEEILRQLREEEIERMLALLETRFRKMLKMQLVVNEETERLAEALKAGSDPSLDARSGKLSFEEKKILLEADKALTLLKEEGSSIAFPEVIEQMREDMSQVVDRLAAVKVGAVTQAIEADIVETLETMIKALQQAQKDQEQRQQQQGQPQEGPPQDPGLVDMIAELRMIRAMEVRVNNRTERYAKFLDNPDDIIGLATEQELQDAIVKLADRQESCQRITRDIVLGKNR